MGTATRVEDRHPERLARITAEEQGPHIVALVDLVFEQVDHELRWIFEASEPTL